MTIKVGDWVAFQVGDEDGDFVAPKKYPAWLPKKQVTPIPRPTHAEVDALRAKVANMEALRDGDAYALRQLVDQLTAANAEIARLKSPDLVTVRREDLMHVLDGLFCAQTDEETKRRIAYMVRGPRNDRGTGLGQQSRD